MRIEIKEIIKKTLEGKRLDLYQIHARLNSVRVHLSPKTIQRYLSTMAKDGLLTKETGERPEGDFVWRRWHDERKRPWIYFYQLNGDYSS